jgi:hypothetical protein
MKKLKMENKPTLKISSNGAKEWYLNGSLHREDGPAIEVPLGMKDCIKPGWYLNGKKLIKSKS